jgi:hypothetical protein
MSHGIATQFYSQYSLISHWFLLNCNQLGNCQNFVCKDEWNGSSFQVLNNDMWMSTISMVLKCYITVWSNKC